MDKIILRGSIRLLAPLHPRDEASPAGRFLTRRSNESALPMKASQSWLASCMGGSKAICRRANRLKRLVVHGSRVWVFMLHQCGYLCFRW